MTNAAEDTHRTIDSAYDQAERFVEGIGSVLGVDMSSGKSDDKVTQIGKPANVRALPVTAKPVLELAASPSESATASLQIVEVDDKGGKRFLVTNGKVGKLCPSREVAERVLALIAAELAKDVTK